MLGKKRRLITYSNKEVAWLHEGDHGTMPRRHAWELFCKKFDRADVNLNNFRAWCKRHRCMTGRTGRFDPGSVPANKGKKMPYNPNSAATQFKPGHGLAGRALQNYKPIGYERLTRDGYLVRKINNDLPMQRRWRAAHLIEWEKRNGSIPSGSCLKCLTNDKGNPDPDNWVMIHRSMLPSLGGGRHGHSYDNAPDELKPAILAQAQIKHAVRTSQKALDDKPQNGDDQ